MMLYMAIVVLLPLLLQSNLGYTAAWAGLATAPVGLIPIVTTPVLGRYGRLVDQRYIISLGFGVFSCVLMYRANFSPQADLRFLIVPQLIMGVSLACFFVPINTLSFIGMDPARIASASGVFNCVRTLFGAIGTSAVTTIWERRESLHHVRLSGLIDPYNPQAIETLDKLTGLGMSQEQALGYIAGQITQQGFIMSGAEIFKLVGICYIFLICLTWLAKRLK
jgi:DHA2 family multidrug resistance protein